MNAREALFELFRLADAHDNGLNTREEAPTGDDYNALWGMIQAAKPALSAPLPTIIIAMNGGIVQDIVSDDPASVTAAINDVLVIDYDNDASDDDSANEFILIPQDDGTTTEGSVSSQHIGKMTLPLAALYREIEAQRDAQEIGWRRTGQGFFEHASGTQENNEAATWTELVDAEKIGDDAEGAAHA